MSAASLRTHTCDHTVLVHTFSMFPITNFIFGILLRTYCMGSERVTFCFLNILCFLVKGKAIYILGGYDSGIFTYDGVGAHAFDFKYPIFSLLNWIIVVAR